MGQLRGSEASELRIAPRPRPRKQSWRGDVSAVVRIEEAKIEDAIDEPEKQTTQEGLMSTPVEAALLQIVNVYPPIAPELTPDQIRAEIEPFLDGLFYDGEEDPNALAVAGLAWLRRGHQPPLF
jgi:hypothetical protein